MPCQHGKNLCRPCEREQEKAGRLMTDDMVSRHAGIKSGHHHPRTGLSDGTRLGDELARLERSNPAVAEAADRFNETIDRIAGKDDEMRKTIALMSRLGVARGPHHARRLLMSRFGSYPKTHQLRLYRHALIKKQEEQQ